MTIRGRSRRIEEPSSFLGWIDFREEDRREAYNLLHATAEHETVDELGLGAIRDGFADRFFPGTTTIMTRLRYYIFAPWIAATLLHECKDRTPSKGAMREMENRLTGRLSKNERTGVIGSESLAQGGPQRLAGEVYWNGLRELGIVSASFGYGYFAARLATLGTSWHAFWSHRDEAGQRPQVGTERRILNESFLLRARICDDQGIPQNISEAGDWMFRLRRWEAEALKRCWLDLDPPWTEKSAFALLISSHAGKAVEDEFSSLPELLDWPIELKSRLEDAAYLSALLGLATQAYVCFVHEKGGRPDEFEQASEELSQRYLRWKEAKSSLGLSTEEILDRTRGFVRTAWDTGLPVFIRQWSRQVEHSSGPKGLLDNAALKTLAWREHSKKGRSHARLLNLGLARDFRRSPIGPLMNYRWPIAASFYRDLFDLHA